MSDCLISLLLFLSKELWLTYFISNFLVYSKFLFIFKLIVYYLMFTIYYYYYYLFTFIANRLYLMFCPIWVRHLNSLYMNSKTKTWFLFLYLFFCHFFKTKQLKNESNITLSPCPSPMPISYLLSENWIASLPKFTIKETF